MFFFLVDVGGDFVEEENDVVFAGAVLEHLLDVIEGDADDVVAVGVAQ